MSRSRFEDLCRGLSPVEREKLADQVQLYPEEMPRGWPLHCEVDQDRIGEQFARLLAEHCHEQQMQQATGPGIIWSRPRRNGKASLDPGPPWTPIAPGVWYAPMGTPAPLPASTWADLETVALEMEPGDELGARRYFLNDLVTAEPPPMRPGAGEQLRGLIDAYHRISDVVPRRIKAGEQALEAIAAAYPPPPKVPAWQSGQIGDLAGIQVVLDPGLAPTAWQLVDPTNGDVLYEGDIDEDATGRHGRVIRERQPDDGLSPFSY